MASIIIPDTFKDADPELLKLAQEAVLKAKQKAEKPKRVKAELSPEQLRAKQLKELTKKLAEANGVKVASKRMGEVKRTNGRGEIRNEEIIQYAYSNGYTRIYLHKGKVASCEWATITFEPANNLFLWNGQKFESLYALHKAFATGSTFSRASTLSSTYFAKDGEKPERTKERRLSEINKEWLYYSPKSGSVASGKPEPEPVADEKPEPEAEDSEVEFEIEEDSVPAPAPAPAPEPVKVVKLGSIRVPRKPKA